jgi:hypothetical protein
MNSPDVNRLFEALRDRTLSFFVGADLARSVTGLPSRSDLARGLAQRYGLDETLSLAEVAQRVSQAGNRFDFTNYIRKELDTTKKSPQAFHLGLAELVRRHHVDVLITTAYDNLLEITFRQAEVGINRLVLDEDISFNIPEWPTLIKLYGDIQQPTSLIVTDDDHVQLLQDQDRKAILDEVRRAFRRNTVFFIGYNLADPDFRFLFNAVAKSQFAHLAYTVWPGMSEVDVRMWRDRKIVIMDADPFGLLKPGEENTDEQPSVRNQVVPIGWGTNEVQTRSQPDQSPRHWVTFKLELARQSGIEFETRALDTPKGQPRAIGELPFDAAELVAVLKVLENGGYQPTDFDTFETKALVRLGLVQDGRLVSNYLERIGKGLYDALCSGDVGVAYQIAFGQARIARSDILLQLRFDSDAVDLARYPWELLHDGHRHPVSAGAVEMIRYITYGEAPPTLPVKSTARLLFIESRPRDLTPLPRESERLTVWNALQSLAATGRLILERLENPTYDALLDRVDSADYHLIHFDGHGVYAKRCPRCGSFNYSHLASCSGCHSPLDEISPRGYLAFEDSAGNADFVSTTDMENLLLNSQVRLIFLSACQTSTVSGISLFGGLGPGLIRAGVPAVVAMQFSVPARTTIRFAESFYRALARGETISRAVAQGRRRLFRESTWFIPTLYLRSQDDEGRVFAT